MPAPQEGAPRKEGLVRLEIPRTSVNLMEEELTGRQKLTVMNYLMLEDSLSALGLQKFGKTTTDNIPLKPVRDWVIQHWDEEFVFDMSKRNIPISFRASLGLALFTTRITEHLAGMEDGVEIYATRDVKEVFRKHKIPEPQGLTTIDYASLPAQAKADLVLPIINNVSDAQLVAQAKALFPNGIPTTALYLADINSIMTLGFSGNHDQAITFDKIEDLETQAMAAGIALRNLGRMGSLIAWASEADKQEKTRKKTGKKQEEIKPDEVKDWNHLDFDKEPDLHYDEGTTFAQVFPFRKDETKEDMMTAFRRITKNKYYRGIVEEPFRGEYLNVRINKAGKLMGYYGWDEDRAGLEDFLEVSDDSAKDQIEVDMLSGKIDYEIADNNRRKTVRALVSELRDDMDTNKQALDLARYTYGQTSFTVEMGFLQAMTGKYQEEATQEEIEEDKRLAREAKQTVAQLSEGDPEEASTKLALISEKPVNMKTAELDYRILSAIREHFSSDPMQIMQMLFSTEPIIRTDNIGEWFKSCCSLLNRYQKVIIDIGQLFAVLGIPPTNDEKTIRIAYHKLATQLHPDKTINMQPEERITAQQQFQETTAAYRNIATRVGKTDTNRLTPTFYLGRISQLFQEETPREDANAL